MPPKPGSVTAELFGEILSRHVKAWHLHAAGAL